MDSGYSLLCMQPVLERDRPNYTLFDLCVLHLYQTQRLSSALEKCEKSRFSLGKILHKEEQETLFGEFRLYSDTDQLLLRETSEGELFIYDRNGKVTLHLEASDEYQQLIPGSQIVHETCPRYKDGKQVVLQKLFIFSDQGLLLVLAYSLEGKVILNYVPYGFCFVLSGEERISFRDHFGNMLYQKSMNILDYYP
nr:hypothetical protein Cbor_75 [Cedratvirus borely]